MQAFGFHESTVTGFQFSGGIFLMELEDVSCGEKTVKVKIEVEAVSIVRVDSEPTTMITMPTEDGEVLSLNICGAEVDALIEWNDFSNGAVITHSYGVVGKKVNMVVI